MSNRTLKIILIAALSLILFPFVVMMLVVFLLAFAIPVMWLLLVPLFALIIFAFRKKTNRSEAGSSQANNVDVILDKIIFILITLNVVWWFFSLQFRIASHPRRMLFFFAVVLPVCAIYLMIKERSNSKSNSTSISNFKRKRF